MRDAGLGVAALAFAIRRLPEGREFPLSKEYRPGCQRSALPCVTPRYLPIPRDATMAKAPPKIDRRNPFIPAQSKVCCALETFFVSTMLVACTAVGLALTLYRLFVE